MERRNGLSTLRSTLGSLENKKEYLNSQITSYRAYLEESTTSTTKNKLVIPLSYLFPSNYVTDLDKL